MTNVHNWNAMRFNVYNTNEYQYICRISNAVRVYVESFVYVKWIL